MCLKLSATTKENACPASQHFRTFRRAACSYTPRLHEISANRKSVGVGILEGDRGSEQDLLWDGVGNLFNKSEDIEEHVWHQGHRTINAVEFMLIRLEHDRGLV